MPSYQALAGASTVAIVALLYQQFIHSLLFDIAGLGRVIQPLDDFAYSCERVYHPKLEACEDLWLDSESRELYLACSGLDARAATRFDTGQFNACSIPPSTGWISVLQIDDVHTDKIYGLRVLGKADGFRGYRGDGTIHPTGFDVERIDENTLRFFVTDQEPLHRPEVGEKCDGLATEKRSAVQAFRYRRGTNDLEFEYELAGDAITLPNRVTVLEDGNLVVANDHTHEGGLRRKLEPLTGGGNLAYCDTKKRHCEAILTKGLAFPNGLRRGPDGLVYVPNCYSGQVQAYAVQQDNHSINLASAFFHPGSLDNLAFDARGDMWAPAVAKLTSFREALDHPYEKTWHSTIWRFSKSARPADRSSQTWQATKILEDVERKVVSGITTVGHDVKTGRLFMSGAYTPYIVVCQPRPSPGGNKDGNQEPFSARR